jgi:surface antigen
VSFPISPLLSQSQNEDSGGEPPEQASPALLDSGDWLRAKAALSAALDPNGDGALIGWENPASGDKGSFMPVGKAYPSASGVCRVFLAKVDRNGTEQSLQGTACADKQGEWRIAGAKPWKKI